MSYCFRIKFRVGTTVHLATTAKELELATASESGESVVLRPSHPGIHLGDAEWLSLRGHGYQNAEDAEAAASTWGSRLRLAFSVLHFGADFGLRAPGGGITEYGLKMLSNQSGKRVLYDLHGTSVFECDPPPVFASMSATAKVGKPVDRLLELMRAARVEDLSMSDREILAFDLYSASFSERSADARFLMLSMALETLIDQARRDDATVAHVARLVTATREAADLPDSDRQSLMGSLKALEQESVGQAGRQLARTLGDRKYMDESATTFFTRCYDLRSALVHGHFPRPDFGEVGARAANLEGFVGDLLGARLL